MAALWNPRALLQVDPLEPRCCSGLTQKGYKCQIIVNKAVRNMASRLLNRMASMSPRDVVPHLLELADLTMCVRFHRDTQDLVVAGDWLDIIYRKFPAIEQPISSPSLNPSASSSSAQTPSQRTPTSTAPLQPVSDLQDRTRSESDVEVSTAPAPPRAITTTTPSSSLDESSSAIAPTQSAAVAAVAPVTQHRTSVLPPTPGTDEAEPTTPPATTSTAETPSPQTTALAPEPRSPVEPSACAHSSRRKPLADECPICNEDMHCLDDAVWCRAQCGTNIHRACFAPWRKVCVDNEATVTCVFCRAPWKNEWEE